MYPPKSELEVILDEESALENTGSGTPSPTPSRVGTVPLAVAP